MSLVFFHVVKVIASSWWTSIILFQECNRSEFESKLFSLVQFASIKTCFQAGPYYDKGWQDPNVRTLLKARQYNFRKRCSWFVQLVKQVMKANAIHLKGSVTRPDSVMLALHTASIYIAWPSQRTQFTEKWFHQVLSKAATRDGKSLNSLPIAKQLDGQVDLCLQVGPLGR